MNLGRIAAIWHKHNYANDRGFESLEAKFFDEFFEAERHLRKQSSDGGDLKNFIAIESKFPIFLDSIDDFNWTSVPVSKFTRYSIESAIGHIEQTIRGADRKNNLKS